MTGREILHKMKVKAGFGSSTSETGKGKSKISGKDIRHGYHLVKGKSSHPMEDYLVAEFKKPEFWSDTEGAIRKAYKITDSKILEKAVELGRGGSTAVTAILIDGVKLVVANVGDSRAVICKNAVAKQLSIDHEPNRERQDIEGKGGFVSNIPGDVPRVDGQLAVARAFGDRSLKVHLSSEPDVGEEMIDDGTEMLILASDGLWKVMSNQEAVDAIKDIKDAQAAAKHLTEAAVARKSSDDISCIVVRFN
ncbi:probable protein phosphatase 2C 62 isoform X2 [Elaeis guineensis]|uniref:protein-serine/threonine phosphatase n=1 Tax=Elaeis guineensis var. tenera TaxID=51953 RepID=A0A6I9RNE9_ELAGV|nr:probable protein phosphatase 2C 62 isoform X2 [Elaeis guineensis]